MFGESGEPNYTTIRRCFTRMWEDCGGVSDCEELVVAIAGDVVNDL